MAPLEVIWPEEMHVLPRPVAYAVMLLCGVQPLTSGVAMRLRYATFIDNVKAVLEYRYLGIPVA